MRFSSRGLGSSVGAQPSLPVLSARAIQSCVSISPGRLRSRISLSRTYHHQPVALLPSVSHHMGLEGLIQKTTSLLASVGHYRICLQLSERWSSSSPSFPFPVPQGDHGDWFVSALRKVWGAGERGGASAAWIAWMTSSLSPHAPEYESVEFLGRQEVV